jgi:thiosulfate/3-mercaptopyruvate sulfurtransferase
VDSLPPIVSVEWLASALDNPDLVVCDVRAYLDGRVGREAYDDGHICGARFIDLDTVLAGAPGPGVGRHPLPSPEDFASGLAVAGIDHHTTVVAYDDSGGMIAGRLVWMLRILGQPAALLDGGIQAWPDPLDTEEPNFSPSAPQPRPWPTDAVVDAQSVDAHIAAGGVVVDSRGPDRYEGQHEPIDPVAGHIPGAINLPFVENLVAGRFHATDVLVERFENAGVDEHTIFYCGSGVSACNNLLAAEAAGRGLGRLYVASWSGYCTR